MCCGGFEGKLLSSHSENLLHIQDSSRLQEENRKLPCKEAESCPFLSAVHCGRVSGRETGHPCQTEFPALSCSHLPARLRSPHKADVGNSWCLCRQSRGGRMEEGADRHHSGPSDWEAPALRTGKRLGGELATRTCGRRC